MSWMSRTHTPSVTPQPQILKTDLLVLIKKLGKLSKDLEETRGSLHFRQSIASKAACVYLVEAATKLFAREIVFVM